MAPRRGVATVSEGFTKAAGDPPIWSWFGASAGGEERRPIDLKKRPRVKSAFGSLKGASI